MRIHQLFPLLVLGFTLVIHLCATRVFAQIVPEVVPQVVVVQFEEGVDFHGKSAITGLQIFDRKAAAYGVHTIEQMYPFLDHVEPTPKTRNNLMALRRTYYVRYRADDTPEQVSRDLSLAPGIVYAEPVPMNRTWGPYDWERTDPNDPKFSEQTYLNALNLPEAWDEVKASDGTPKVVIAIVDGGGEWRHEDLHANVWTNEDEIPDNGIDDDNNEFIDDVHGVNFANEDHSDPTGLPETPSNAEHGTAVAGAASAVTDNNVGVSGAAWNAELMHINVGCPPSSDMPICEGYEGILYAAINGADIINASWGGVQRNEAEVRHLDETLDLVTDMGSLVVTAAGNSNSSIDESLFYPARHPRVLSVGATEKDTRVRWEFSNWGKLVNVFAPGVNIATTGSNNEYVNVEGTSFASPLTAGVAALVKTRFPDLSPDALREHVRLTSENIDAENPEFRGQMGRGFVNALAAVQEPTLPAIRLQNWSWEDQDGNRIIEPSNVVTITLDVINHLNDANQLQIELVGEEPYSFLEWSTSEVEVGPLAGGASTEVTFEFTVASNAPPDQLVRFFLHIRDGDFEDVADRISLRINQQLELVYQGLKALYLATDGDNWTRNDNWDITKIPTEEELANWAGVSLSEGFLAQLNMINNNLNGILPPELENLETLQSLQLSENEGLTGRIPSELGNLPKLQNLSLRNNSLSGSIPSELGNLEQLSVLFLSGNSLSGSIPSELGNLAQLGGLYLELNLLTGSIPSELGNLEQLSDLHLYSNSLSGPIPSELGNLKQLRDLLLYNNSLSGPISAEFGNLQQLRGLRLDSNSLTGSIPSELGNLQQLQNLRLDTNTLTGSIPSELGNLQQLKDLFLNNNSLTESIPSELGNLQQLRGLRLDSNSLSGQIPPELGNLQELDFLGLSDNSLSGPIPSELGNLSSLGSLLLSGNDFTGQIPRSFMQLDNLIVFHYEGQSLCAPADDEFQMWLRSIPNHRGPTCGGLQFVVDIADQSFPRSLPITPLILPEAQGGIPPITYALTPSLPNGLVYDSSTRTISGTPLVVTSSPIPYTFTATDAVDALVSVVFNIEVFSPVASEQDGLPESFTVHENYPNPFWESTLLVVDLPWSATLNVEVFDLTGRNVLSLPSVDLTSGWNQNIRLEGATLPSGLYLYKIHVKSEVETHTHAGQFVRMR